MAISLVILALGGSVGMARWLLAQSGRISVPMDPVTRMPVPYLSGHYLVNPTTGEVIDVRNPRQVDSHRAALLAMTTQTAILARATERVASHTEQQAADALPGIAANLRAILPEKRE